MTRPSTSTLIKVGGIVLIFLCFNQTLMSGISLLTRLDTVAAQTINRVGR